MTGLAGTMTSVLLTWREKQTGGMDNGPHLMNFTKIEPTEFLGKELQDFILVLIPIQCLFPMLDQINTLISQKYAQVK